MSYAVKEIFYTLQGEGAKFGRAAVFCRFSGCNLWSGLEEDRSSAICQFCDTDFVGVDGPGGGRFETAQDLARAVADCWPGGPGPLVVCTGGEPLLQLDDELVAGFKGHGFEIAIETNGTRVPPADVDWVCVSPKAGSETVLRSGSELKVVFPQVGYEPTQFEDWDFEHFFIQPMAGEEYEENLSAAVQFCLENPKWRLSLQTHKLIGIP